MASRRASKTHALSERVSQAPDSSHVAETRDQTGAAFLARRVAETLRILRKQRELSLCELATISGVSRATLWQMERSRTNPTLSLLWKVAVGLGVPFHALVGSEASGKPQILRDGDSPTMHNSSGAMQSRLLSPAGANQHVDIYELRFAPAGLHQSEPHGEGTTETVFILAGALRVAASGETHDLAEGDSIFFRADLPHSYESRSRWETRCINVVSHRCS